MPAPNHIALVGCGAWGQNILRDLKAIGCEVTVVARSEASVERARAHDPEAIVDDLQRVQDPSGVVIAVPTLLHHVTIEAATSFGVPIYVEKPLTADVATARDLARRTDVFVMDKWRYHSGVLALSEAIGSGRFGGLRGVQTVRHSLYNPHTDVDGVWILAPHDLSIILELTGAIGDPLGAVGLQDGLEASLTGLLAGNASIDVSSRSNVYRREVRTWTDEAVITLSGGYADSLDVRVTSDGTEPRADVIPFEPNMPLETELRAFVDYLGGGPPPKSSAAEGARTVEVIHELRAMAGI